MLRVKPVMHMIEPGTVVLFITRLCGMSYRYRVSGYPKIYRRIVYDTFGRLLGRGMAMGLAIPASSFRKIVPLQRYEPLQRGCVYQDILGGRKLPRCICPKTWDKLRNIISNIAISINLGCRTVLLHHSRLLRRSAVEKN